MSVNRPETSIEQEPNSISHIIVLGKNFDDEKGWEEIAVHRGTKRRRKKVLGALSNSSKLNVIAAVKLLQQHPEMEAIFSTGVTDRSGKYAAGESEAMLAYARQLCNNNPQIIDRIQIENVSINTDENAMFVKKLLEHDHMRTRSYAILTTKYHLPRAIRRFERHFGEGSFCRDSQHIASEDIIKKLKNKGKLTREQQDVYELHRFSRYRAKQIILETSIHIAHIIAPHFTEHLLDKLSASRGSKPATGKS